LHHFLTNLITRPFELSLPRRIFMSRLILKIRRIFSIINCPMPKSITKN